MSMHIEGPWLSTTGKKKGKQKFRNAEQARKSRELADSWQKLLSKYDTKPVATKKKAEPYKPPKAFVRDDPTKHIKSLDTGVGVAPKKESPKYTGTLIKGIATMHKSNAVPILNQEDAEAISKMRR